MIVTIGDSNARLFSLCGPHHVHNGMTMHTVGLFGVPNVHTTPGDVVLFAFGEVDVRVHIPKIAKHEAQSESAVCNGVAQIYADAIHAFCLARNTTPLVCTCPPPAEKTSPDAIVPVVDSIECRVRRAIIMNDILWGKCASRDIQVFDPWGEFRLKDGQMDMAKSDGIVHVADHFQGRIKEIVQGALSPG